MVTITGLPRHKENGEFVSPFSDRENTGYLLKILKFCFYTGNQNRKIRELKNNELTI